MMAIINNSKMSSSSSSGTAASSSHHNGCHNGPSSSNSSCNSVDDENVSCPLCMENLDIDDRSFYPCTCGYQICRFCWHRIRSESDDQNGLCPACRKAYSENPATFKPLTSEDIQKLKHQKRQKDQQKKQKSENGKRHLADLRVVQRNLVFVVGISPRIADPDVLKKNEFFGKFGKIHKVVVNPCLQGTTASAYITYIRSEDALRAIQSVNNIPFDGKTIKVSLGTTKYCSHFMRNQTCPKSECMYLHHYGDPEASFTKEDMQAGKHQEYEKKLLDEFNQNNNNNEAQQAQQQSNGSVNSGGGFSKEAPVLTKPSKNNLPKSKAIPVSAIQQGVSYSTKLLVNTPPTSLQSTAPTPSTTSSSASLLPQPPPPSSSPSSTSSSPPSSTSSSPPTSSNIMHHHGLLNSTSDPLQAATKLLESSTLDSECDEDDSPDFLLPNHHAPPRSETSDSTHGSIQEETSKHDEHDGFDQNQFDELGGNVFSSSTLELDFDPFHETQKAFEQIINEQVGETEQHERVSRLARFMKHSGAEHDNSQPFILGGFHGSQQQQHQYGAPQSDSLHQPHAPQNTSSLLLDFFNNYAYKSSQPSSIPPPPGFSTPPTTTSSQPQPLDKLVVQSRVLNGTVWSDTPDAVNTTPDWMSLDPAIIFSKTSSNASNQTGQNFRHDGTHPLHAGIFNNVFPNNIHNQHLPDSRVLQNNFHPLHHHQQQHAPHHHTLIRPTPTTTPQQQYAQPNAPVQSYGSTQQQHPASPQQQFYTSSRTASVYFPSTQQQQFDHIPRSPRYFPTPTSQQQQQNPTSVVTPPPPGFGGLLNNNFNQKPVLQHTQLLQQQQMMTHHQLHQISSTGAPPQTTNASNFFPF